MGLLSFITCKMGAHAGPNFKGSPVLVRKDGETEAAQIGIVSWPKDAELKSRYLLVKVEPRTDGAHFTDMPRDRNK